MHDLITKEKQIIDKLLLYKENGKIEELQVMRLLRKHLNRLAIIWSVNPKPVLSIYYKEDMSPNEIEKDYFELCDFLYFIDSLVKGGYVAVQHTISPQVTNQRLLYDRDLYDYLKEYNMFFYKQNHQKQAFAVKQKYICNHHLDIVEKIEQYANCLVYPLPSLKEFKKNDYMPTEQYRYQKQLCRTNVSLIIAGLACMGTFISPYLENYCSNNEVYENITQKEEPFKLSKPTNNKTNIPYLNKDSTIIN